MNFGRRSSAFVVPPSGGIRPPPEGGTTSKSRSVLVILFFLPVLCPLVLPAADNAAPTSPPAVNWVLPLFTDRDGYRSMTLRGATVKPAGANGIVVTDLNVTVFSGDATARVESVLLSQDATYYPRETRVTGEKNVRVLRDELEVTGENWSYEHSGKKVSIRKDVRVVYRAPLKIPL